MSQSIDLQDLQEFESALTKSIEPQLSKWLSPRNIFSILKLDNFEIRHSNFLQWLFDPQKHDYQDYFLKAFLTKVYTQSAQNPATKNLFPPLNLTVDYRDSTILREFHNIDLLIRSESQHLTLIIENKINSDQHDNQLNRYYQDVKNHVSNSEKIICIYLTKDEKDADNPHWLSLSYQAIYDILTDLINTKSQIKPGSREAIYIEDYLNLLEVSVLDNKELKDTIQHIYNQHRAAIDLLIANIPDNYQILHEDVATALTELNEEHPELDYQPNYAQRGGGYFRFRTKNLTQLYPSTYFDHLNGKSGWADNPYFWEIHLTPTNTQISLVFQSLDNPDIQAISKQFMESHATDAVSEGHFSHFFKQPLFDLANIDEYVQSPQYSYDRLKNAIERAIITVINYH